MNNLFHNQCESTTCLRQCQKKKKKKKKKKNEKICVKQAKRDIERYNYNNMSNIYRRVYFRILCSLFFNKYVSVCHPSDRGINWRPAVQEETFLCRLKNTTIIYMITRNPWERERQRQRQRVAVYVKIRKAQRVWCTMCSSSAFFRVISFILIDIIRWTTLLLMFVWTPSYEIPYVNPFIFKISNFAQIIVAKNKSW